MKTILKDQKMTSSAKKSVRIDSSSNATFSFVGKNCPLYRCDGDEKFDSGAIIDKFLLQTHVDILKVNGNNKANAQPLLKKEEINEAEEAYMEQQLLSDYESAWG